MIREIPFSEIPGVKIGQCDLPEGGSGCTVFLFENGATASCDIRGGGPASRETELLRPEKTVQQIHAAVLSGGSAFGLEAGDGVMQYLSEHGVGFDVGIGSKRIPIVCGASLFDVAIGDPECYPNKEAGYRACVAAEKGEEPQSGNHGAGTGATVGKITGGDRAMKSGIGFYAAECGGVKVGAGVAVNAIGDVTRHTDGTILAGLRTEDGNGIYGTQRAMEEALSANSADAGAEDATKRTEKPADGPVTNTTISCVVTDVKLTKTQCAKLAQTMADAYARSIRPVHTTLDGDSVFFVSTGEASVDPDLLSVMAEEVLSRAIERAVLTAETAYGLPAAKDLN